MNPVTANSETVKNATTSEPKKYSKIYTLTLPFARLHILILNNTLNFRGKKKKKEMLSMLLVNY